MLLNYPAVALASAFLMIQPTPPDMPDGGPSDVGCRKIAYQCQQNFQGLGYSSPALCFDGITGGSCPPPGEEGPSLDRSWTYWEGVINRCTNPCW